MDTSDIKVGDYVSFSERKVRRIKEVLIDAFLIERRPGDGLYEMWHIDNVRKATWQEANLSAEEYIDDEMIERLEREEKRHKEEMSYLKKQRWYRVFEEEKKIREMYKNT